MKFNIMFVDDSISVLESLQWIFKDEPYSVFFSNNPRDALQVTNTLEWTVVAADQSMQNMDGLEFLKRFQAQSPLTIGIIMTGYNEKERAVDTLSPGCMYRFVKKPLNHIEIKNAVKMAISDYETHSNVKKNAII